MHAHIKFLIPPAILFLSFLFLIEEPLDSTYCFFSSLVGDTKRTHLRRVERDSWDGLDSSFTYNAWDGMGWDGMGWLRQQDGNGVGVGWRDGGLFGLYHYGIGSFI